MPVNNNMPVAESDDAEEFSTETTKPGSDSENRISVKTKQPPIERQVASEV